MAQQQIDESEEHEQNLPRDGGPLVRTLVEATIRSLCALQAKSHRCRSPQRMVRKQCSPDWTRQALISSQGRRSRLSEALPEEADDDRASCPVRLKIHQEFRDRMTLLPLPELPD